MTRTRSALATLAVAALLCLLVATRDASGDPPIDGMPMPPVAYEPPPPVFDPSPYLFEIRLLRRKLTVEHRRYLAVHRTLMHRSSTREAIDLACTVYGSCSTLWRRAQCESHLYPLARNRSGASGLFQFLPSTFASTPFASLSIFSPYANALAAGWMIVNGRGGEWSCR